MAPGDGSGGVFADRAVLAEDYRPASFDNRETELAALRTALSPALVGTGPATVLLTGPPAQGKRTAVGILCESAIDTDGLPDPRLLAVDCAGGRTAYDLAISITNQLVGENTLSKSGYTRETAFRRLRNAIRESGDPPLVRLDGVEALESAELDRLLAGLFDDFGTLVCGLVAIADKPTYRNSLPPALRDRFHAEVSFGPYDESALRKILDERASAAFVDGGCPDETTDACLEATAASDAPLRTALDLLRRAGDEALANGDAAVADGDAAVADGDQRVTPDHVAAARDAVERDRIASILEALSGQERRTLAAVLDAAESGRFADVYAAYERRCADAGEEPNRERSVHNYLGALESAGLIETEERRSKEGGRYFEYRCRPGAETVRAALDAVDAVGAVDAADGAPAQE